MMILNPCLCVCCNHADPSLCGCACHADGMCATPSTPQRVASLNLRDNEMGRRARHEERYGRLELEGYDEQRTGDETL